MNCPPRSRVGGEGGGRKRTKPYVSRHVPRANEPRGFNYPFIFYLTKNQNVEIFVIITNFCELKKKICTVVTSFLNK